MESIVLNSDNKYTAFVQLNTNLCTACWKCIDACPDNVIDKSFLYIGSTIVHEHVLLYDAAQCSGCLKCLDACNDDAISICEE